MGKLLSLCMIVKNEEKVLARCLDSVQGIVDEIIIVDTGSTDRTKEIAANYTDQVFDFVWTQDFSAARNEAIRRATSKWTLVLDADEYIERSDGESLRLFLSSYTTARRVILTVPVLSETGNAGNFVEAYVGRLFPSGKGFYFHRPIHEQLTCDTGEISIIKIDDFRIYHSGYTTETLREKNKSQRNMEIFDKIRKSGKMSKYDYFTLGNEYKATQEYSKAIECYQKAFSNLNVQYEWYKNCLINQIDCLIALDQCHRAYELIEGHLSKWSRYPEYHTLKALVFNKLGFFEHGRAECETAIRIAEEGMKQNKTYWLLSPSYGGMFPYQFLADHYCRKQDMHKTVFYLSRILNERPSHFHTLYRLLAILSQTEDTQSIVTLLNKLYPKQSNYDLSLLLSTSLRLGHAELSEHFISKMRAAGTEVRLLRYAILKRDRSMYEQNREATGTVNLDGVMPELMAALLWNTEEYLPPVAEEQKIQFISSFVQTAIRGDRSIITPTSEQEAALFQLLVELYRYQLYDIYDLLLKRISSAGLINALANYYYDHHHLDLALDYYSILLQENQISVQGYENLAHLYFNQGEVEEGLNFLKAAIEQVPRKIHLYAVLNEVCTDKQTVKEYWSQGFMHFPQYKSVVSQIIKQ